MSDTRAEIDVDSSLARSLAERGFAARPGDRIYVTRVVNVPDRRGRLRDVVRRPLKRRPSKEQVAAEHPASHEPSVAEGLPSFARSFKGAPDLAARSKEILRTELGR